MPSLQRANSFILPVLRILLHCIARRCRYAATRPRPAAARRSVRSARDAVARRKTMVITHSEISPGTYASTTETADWLLTRLKLTRRPVSRPAPGPLGIREVSEVRAGKFRVMGYAGKTAEDHVGQFESLPWQLKLLW
jgi:hypothetical protein